MGNESTQLILVRHGETAHNARRMFQGQLDTELNDRGRAQAAAAAERLRRVEFDRCYSSDLARAAETARIIVGHDAPRMDRRLRERHFGAWQGLAHEQVTAEDPDGFRRFQAAEPDYAPAGGETWRGFCDRAWGVIEAIARDESGRRVLVVTHGGILRAVAKRILGLPLEAPRRFSITNCALNRISCDERGWRIDSWGEADHLEALGYIRL